jgi:hypothetical protein
MLDKIMEKAKQLNLECQSIQGRYHLCGKMRLSTEAKAFLEGYQHALNRMSDETRLAFLESYNARNTALNQLKSALPQNFDMERFNALHVAEVGTLTQSIGGKL